MWEWTHKFLLHDFSFIVPLSANSKTDLETSTNPSIRIESTTTSSIRGRFTWSTARTCTNKHERPKPFGWRGFHPMTMIHEPERNFRLLHTALSLSSTHRRRRRGRHRRRLHPCRHRIVRSVNIELSVANPAERTHASTSPLLLLLSSGASPLSCSAFSIAYLWTHSAQRKHCWRTAYRAQFAQSPWRRCRSERARARRVQLSCDIDAWRFDIFCVWSSRAWLLWVAVAVIVWIVFADSDLRRVCVPSSECSKYHCHPGSLRPTRNDQRMHGKC